MKKLMIIFALFMYVGALMAQSFSCDKILSDVSKFNKSQLSSNKKWAVAVLKDFPLSTDGNISYRYILTPSDSIVDVERAMTVTHNWLKQIFKKPDESIKEIDTDKHVFTCVCNYGDAAQYYGLGGATFIESPIDLKIEIYEENIVIKMRARQYALRGVNYYTGAQKELISISAAYPVVTDKDHKESYAMAFINTNGRCLGACKEYLGWMNGHYDISKDTEDW